MGLALSQPESPEIFKISTDAELAATKIFGGDYKGIIENVLVNHVSVYKTSHRDKHTKTTQTGFKNRFTPENFLSFVVLSTDKGVQLSIEKHNFTDIYLGKCCSLEPLINNRMEAFSKTQDPPADLLCEDPPQAELLVEDKSSLSLLTLIANLTDIHWRRERCNWTCQRFAKELFDELAESKHDDFFKMDCECNVAEQIFGSDFQNVIDNNAVTSAAVFKTPLEGIYRKSNETIREAIGRQWTSVDYHAFVIMRTSCGICLSFEKQKDGIYIGKSPWYTYLVFRMGASPRKAPVELVIKDESNFPLNRLMGILEGEKSGYSATDDNCQHFSKRQFDKVALNKTWEFTRPYKFFCKLFALFILFAILVPHVPHILFTCLHTMQIIVHFVLYRMYDVLCLLSYVAEILYTILTVYLPGFVFVILLLDYGGLHIFGERFVSGLYRLLNAWVICLILWVLIFKK